LKVLLGTTWEVDMNCINCNKETDNLKFCSQHCSAIFNKRYADESGIIRRQKALDEYYFNPNYCGYCGEVIDVREGKVTQTRKKKFCNSSCAASFNNKTTKKKEDRFCFVCGKKLNKRLKKYCSYHCQQEDYSSIAIGKWISGEWDGTVGKEFKIISNYIRNYLLKESDGRCNICKNSTWLGEPIPLEIHHKDGNWKNNRRENLDVICPNCHALETKNHKFSNKSPDIYRNKVRKEKTYRNITS
jgi:hypothetical protein